MPLSAFQSFPFVLAQSGSPAMPWLYAGFIALVLIFLAIDLGVFNRKAHIISAKEAGIWSAIWASCALGFTVFIFFAYQSHLFGLGLNVPVVGQPGQTITVTGAPAAQQFLAGYIVEWSLSMDNLFVIAVIFKFFAVPAIFQHRVLFWGILGALLLRGVMIALGAVLIQRFGWITYVFGGFLMLTAVKMAFVGEEHVHPDKNILVRAVRAIWPVSSHYDGQRFFTRVPGPDGATRRAVTPLFLALIVVEFTDVIFAVDSVPAVFAITGDPFLVLTSNVFAILGLRSLYFLLASMLGSFRYLKHALVLILAFVGVKMLIVHSPFKISTAVSLFVILGLLAAGVGASLLRDRFTRARPPVALPGDDLAQAVRLARKNFRKALILIAGTAVVLFGVAIAPLPGPGPTVLVPLGLVILATEFIWAQRLLKILKEQTEQFAKRGDAASAKMPRWFLLPIMLCFYGFFAMLWFATDLPRIAVLGACFGLSVPLSMWIYRVLKLTRPSAP